MQRKIFFIAIMFFTVIFLMGLPLKAKAFPGTSLWKVIPISEGHNFANWVPQHAIAITEDGAIYITYGGSGGIWIAKKTANSDNFSITQIDNNTNDYDYVFTSTSIANGSEPHVAYNGISGDDYCIKHAYFDGSQWKKNIIYNNDTYSADIGYYTSVSVDKNGRVFVAYEEEGDYDSYVKYRYSTDNGNSWANFSDDEGTIDYYDGVEGISSMLTDKDNKTFISYGLYDNDDDEYILYYAYFDNSSNSWNSQEIISSEFHELSEKSMALDNDTIYILFIQNKTLRVAYKQIGNSSWSFDNITTLSVDDDVDKPMELLLDSNNTPYVIYVDNGQIKLAQKNSQQWSISTICSGRTATAVFDKNDNLIIGYMDNDGRLMVKYNNNTYFVDRTVSADSVKIARGIEGSLHAVYRDEISRKLYYSYFSFSSNRWSDPEFVTSGWSYDISAYDNNTVYISCIDNGVLKNAIKDGNAFKIDNVTNLSIYFTDISANAYQNGIKILFEDYTNNNRYLELAEYTGNNNYDISTIGITKSRYRITSGLDSNGNLFALGEEGDYFEYSSDNNSWSISQIPFEFSSLGVSKDGAVYLKTNDESLYKKVNNKWAWQSYVGFDSMHECIYVDSLNRVYMGGIRSYYYQPCGDMFFSFFNGDQLLNRYCDFEGVTNDADKKFITVDNRGFPVMVFIKNKQVYSAFWNGPFIDNITVSSNNINPHESITFTASAREANSSATITDYLWDFGDNSTATGRTVIHRFDKPGNYYVTLRVVDSNNISVSGMTTRITVKGPGAVEWIMPFSSDYNIRKIVQDASSNLYMTYLNDNTRGGGLISVSSTGTKRWDFKINNRINNFISTPVVTTINGKDVVIFLSDIKDNDTGNYNCRLYQIYADNGSIRDNLKISDSLCSSTSLAVSSNILYSSFYDKDNETVDIFAFNLDNSSIIWKFIKNENISLYSPKPTCEAVSIGYEGDIYCLDYKNKITALYDNGTLKWSISLPLSSNIIYNCFKDYMPLDENGNLYVFRGYSSLSNINAIYKISTDNGSIENSLVFDTTDYILSKNGFVEGNGTIYLTYPGGKFAKINTQNLSLTNFQNSDNMYFRDNPVIGSNYIYISADKCIYLINKNDFSEYGKFEHIFDPSADYIPKFILLSNDGSALYVLYSKLFTRYKGIEKITANDRLDTVSWPAIYKDNSNSSSIEGQTFSQSSTLVSDNSSLDFGNINTGDNATISIHLTNVGIYTSSIDNISVSNNEFHISSSGCSTIQPNGECSLDINFAPESEGEKTGNLIITYESNNQLKTLSIELRGRGVSQNQLTGDLNGDGEVNILDVILCLRQAIGLDSQNLLSSDLNGDGEVNILDVILILKIAIQ